MGGFKAIISRNIVLYFLFAIMFFFAISSTITGILIPAMNGDYAMTSAQVGNIGAAQSAGGLLVLLLGGLLSDRFPKAGMIAAAFLLYTAFLYLFGLMPPYPLLLACFLLLGASSASLNMLISAYVPELRPEQGARLLSVCHGFFSLGSLAGPVYAAVLLARGVRWNGVFASVGAICTAVAAAFLIALASRGGRAAAKPAPPAAAVKREPYLRLLGDPRMLLLCLSCLLFMGQQIVINIFVTDFTVKAVSAELSGAPIIFYWAGVVAGRFAQSIVTRKIDARKWLALGGFSGGALILSGLLAHNVYWLIAAMLLGGILTGAAFPSVIAMACGLHPARTGAATSLICLSASVGGMALPWLAGNAAIWAGSDFWGMALVPAALFAASALLLPLGKRMKGSPAG